MVLKGKSWKNCFNAKLRFQAAVPGLYVLVSSLQVCLYFSNIASNVPLWHHCETLVSKGSHEHWDNCFSCLNLYGTAKLLNIRTPEKYTVIILKLTFLIFHREMRPKDTDGMANSVNPSRSSLIWVYTVCSDLSVRKFRNITVVWLWSMENGEKCDLGRCLSRPVFPNT